LISKSILFLRSLFLLKKIFSPSHLIESKDKEGKEWDVVLIQAGRSLNNKYYPPEVLKKAIPLFEKAKAYAYEFKGKIWNHMPEAVRKVFPEGTLKNLVGWYDNIHYGTFEDADGRTKEGILARFHIVDTAKWLMSLLKEAWEYGKKALLGFSIDGGGDVEKGFEEGKEVIKVNEIKSIDEITLVSHAAAGGKFQRLLASKFYMEENEMNFLKELYKWAKQIKESLIEGINPDEITEEQKFELIKGLVECEEFPPKDEKLAEAIAPFASAMIDEIIKAVEGDKKAEAVKLLKDLRAKMKAYKYPAAKESEEQKKTREAKEKEEADKKVKEAADKKKLEEERAKMTEIDKMKKDVETMKENTQKKECAATLKEQLAGSKLPQLVKDKISKRFQDKVFEAKELENVMKEEKEILGKLSESGEINGLGDVKDDIDVISDEADKIQAAMDLMVDDQAKIPDKLKESVHGGFNSILEAYRAVHPEDPNVTGRVGKRTKMGSLKEAITTADFSYILNTSMTKRITKEYKVKPFIFAPIVTEVPVTNFKQQERVKWGGWSTLPTVTAGAYADLFEPHDEEATYTPGTKGGLVSVSRATIKNDDLGYIKKIPSKVVKAARKTLERDVMALLLANGTYTPTNSTVFSTIFNNYSTNAFSYDHLTDASDGIAAQKERGASEDAGTADGDYSTTTLSDSTKSWDVNEWAGRYVRLVYGTGAGQMSLIASNTATKLTFAAITTQADATTKYEISTASNDDEEMGLDGKFIIHGLKTRAKVRSITNSDKNPTNMAEDNVHKGVYTTIYAPTIKGSTYQYYWFLVIDKADGETIEIGYVDNQRTPLLVVQDQPTLGQVFTNDTIRYKVRYEYGLEIIDNRGIYANFATSI